MLTHRHNHLPLLVPARFSRSGGCSRLPSLREQHNQNTSPSDMKGRGQLSEASLLHSLERIHTRILQNDIPASTQTVNENLEDSSSSYSQR